MKLEQVNELKERVFNVIDGELRTWNSWVVRSVISVRCSVFSISTNSYLP
jgi:hypothetical protein